MSENLLVARGFVVAVIAVLDLLSVSVSRKLVSVSDVTCDVGDIPT